MAAWLSRLFFSFYMSLFLSVLMTGWVTYINIGLTESYLKHWWTAFWLAWPAAFIIAFSCAGIVRRMAEASVKSLVKG